MKHCLSCSRRAYLADRYCRRCGALVDPPPPSWVVPLVRAATGLYVVLLVFNGWRWLTGSAEGRDVTAYAQRVAHYVIANRSDLVGFVFAFLVAPLVGLCFTLRAMVDVGDAIDSKMQRWRAERLRKYGWVRPGDGE
jgi:hypothetical protein